MSQPNLQTQAQPSNFYGTVGGPTTIQQPIANLSTSSLANQNVGVGEDDSACTTALHWFRRGLRFHDNPALFDSFSASQDLRCIYIIDPTTINSTSDVEINKWRFLLESLNDLDNTLRKYNSRLYVLQGQPTFILPTLFKDWSVNILSIEEDPTPYGAKRDEAIGSLASEHGVCVIKQSSHTLHPLSKLLELSDGKEIRTFKQFTAIFKEAGEPSNDIESIPFDKISQTASKMDPDSKYSVPSLDDLGIHVTQSVDAVVWHGGESEALRRLAYHLERRAWVACFDKPKLTSKSLMAAPSDLGPYLNFGCLSPRLLYWKIDALYKQIHGMSSIPPSSLHGQLMMRDYYYLIANINDRFDKVQGNKLCLQIPWKKTSLDVMKKVAQAATGFPWIDAIIRQLVSEGWIHGLAKHALISFITHGQLFFSWEEAASLLEKYSLEGDICINNGVAMMLSGSSVAKSQPTNIVSPVLLGRAIDQQADFIRHYLPLLKSYPCEYIYEPWTAPLEVQQQAGCIIGHDYPAPILDHYQALHSNMLTLQQFLNAVRDRRANKRRHVHSDLLSLSMMSSQNHHHHTSFRSHSGTASHTPY